MARSPYNPKFIKQLIKQKQNGSYATVICAYCLNFKSEPESHIDNAIVTEHCPLCHPDLLYWR